MGLWIGLKTNSEVSKIPRQKITREMILDEAFKITRELGIDSVNTGVVSKSLGCSVQPIYSYFKNMDDLKIAIYNKTHREFNDRFNSDTSMEFAILEYVKFAYEEKNLFSLLFLGNFHEMYSKSKKQDGKSDMFMELLSEDKKDNKKFDYFIFAHGIASLIVNNKLNMNFEEIKIYLKQFNNKFK